MLFRLWKVFKYMSVDLCIDLGIVLQPNLNFCLIRNPTIPQPTNPHTSKNNYSFVPGVMVAEVSGVPFFEIHVSNPVSTAWNELVHALRRTLLCGDVVLSANAACPSRILRVALAVLGSRRAATQGVLLETAFPLL